MSQLCSVQFNHSQNQAIWAGQMRRSTSINVNGRRTFLFWGQIVLLDDHFRLCAPIDLCQLLPPLARSWNDKRKNGREHPKRPESTLLLAINQLNKLIALCWSVAGRANRRLLRLLMLGVRLRVHTAHTSFPGGRRRGRRQRKSE